MVVIAVLVVDCGCGLIVVVVGAGEDVSEKRKWISTPGVTLPILPARRKRMMMVVTMIMMVTMSFPVMHTDNGNPGIRIFPVQRVQHFFLLQVLKSSRFNTKKYICYSTMGVFFWSHCNLKVLTFGGNYLQDI